MRKSKMKWPVQKGLRVLVCFLILAGLIATGYFYSQRSQSSPDLFVANDTASGDWFGSAVDEFGGTLVVTAFKADTHEKDTGAAYVFTRTEGRAVKLVQKIMAPDAQAGDEFGFDVVMNQRWMAISRLAGFSDRSKKRTQGDVLVFERHSVEALWDFRFTIQEPVPVSGNYFGFSLDLAGDLLAIGAAYSQRDEGRPGAAYVVDLAANHTTVVPLEIPMANDADAIGSDVLFVDDRLFVGAPGTSLDGVAEVGVVYEFMLQDLKQPELVRTLKPNELLAEDRFGTSIANPVGFLAVGASHWASKGNNEIAWLFSLKFDNPVGKRITLPTKNLGAMLGFRATACDDYLVLSAHLESSSSVPTAGAAHLFQVVNNTAQYVGRLSAQIPAKDDFFGVAIACGPDGVLVGSEKADQSGNGSGAAGYFLYNDFEPLGGPET